MSKQDAIKARGSVIEAYKGDRFRVELDNGVTILASISGRLWQRHIRIIPGDRVEVEMSPYDLTHGRISYRLKIED